MNATTFEIEVQDDHLQRLAQVQKPILAVAELIWNAVDADADRVDVILHDDKLGGTNAREVVMRQAGEERGHPLRVGGRASRRCLYCTQSHPPR